MIIEEMKQLKKCLERSERALHKSRAKLRQIIEKLEDHDANMWYEKLLWCQNKEPIADFNDKRVQAVYNILCSDESPPSEEHWEGFVARRIVDELFADQAQPVTWFDKELNGFKDKT